MHVLMSAYACLPDAGSEPGTGWHWAVSIAARGLDVSVLTTGHHRERVTAYLRQHPIPRLTVHFVDLNSKYLHEGTGPHYLLWQWQALRKARQLAKSETFDLVHHVSYGSVHVPTQLWRLGLPVVFGPVGGAQTTPESMLPFFGPSQGSERRRTLLTRLLRFSPWHRHALSRMAAILVANRETKAFVSALGRPDAELLFDTGVAAEDLPDTPRTFEAHPGPLRILWVGRMMPRKALNLSLDILARVQCDFTLTIAGEGLSQEQVNGMIAARNLTGKVQWAGHRLPFSAVQQAYRSHDLLLFNSLRESGGSQLLEAMTMGLPILTLDLHGPGDLVPNDAGFKVPVHSPEQVTQEMAAAVDRFAALSPEQRSSMARSAFAFVQTNTHEQRARRAEAIYRRVLNTPS